MHNAAFNHIGLDWCYLPFRVHPDSLRPAVEAIKALDMAGVNITVPHKETVMALLHEIDEEALFIGAVNTIVNHEGRLKGYNTDGRGFMHSLSEKNITVKDRNILIVGAGGASRAISYYLSDLAKTLCLFDVDAAKAKKLSSDFLKIRSNISSIERINKLSDFDIIINATPLGLKKNDPLPLDTSVLSPEQIVCDLIYTETRLLLEASDRGCVTVNGSGMLLWQGALAFELWTSVSPPVDVMKSALLSKIT